MATMRAVLLRKAHDVRVDDVERPTVTDPGDVLLKVEKTAICGTDLHPYEGRLELEEDVVLGHEFLGTVVETGAAVTQFEEGDRAVASCVVSCGACYNCRRQRPGQCLGTRIFGLGIVFGSLSGGQAEYVVVPNADLVMRRIDDEGRGTDEDKLFVGDIMATGYEAVRKVMRPGDTVAVVGAGPVGLCAAMAANVLGAGQVAVVDKVPSRLAEAEAIGAIGVNASETDPAEAVQDLTEWRGADVVIDAVGHPSALLSACSLVASGGALSIPGVYTEDAIELPFGELYLKGVTIHQGVANIINYMDETLALIAAGKLDPSRFISHRMPMSEAAEAYRMFEAREATKIVLDPTA
ncbi:alcohol dehydrogenase catalytic domain-containing protein [Actinomycetospora sp. TBRC 11914]|uniref:alcohol dehydrogenase catalytic domain-containing protein n=1 Tax=Actinomycetospora sp. TBRC 11914 TaxID=2729387 RepID=UPI00145EC3E3|nr:alcohol dehydrogenase catalytic domain-containing protein [Actinomycetospora sp. TBRC 11914]NMO93650.1 alcohol dehydrogenase catalytic domain-containing protein [Actinomycetospora sp. TBRC 11914]